MKTETKPSSREAQFAAACLSLKSALDAQHHPSQSPSETVRWAIFRILSFDLEWRRGLGEYVADAMRQCAPSEGEHE